MSSEHENNEKKVLSRREALKRCAALTLGIAAISVCKVALADDYSSSPQYYSHCDGCPVQNKP